MGRLSTFLVQRHWDIFKVVFPSSIGFGFLYTMQYGTSPLTDAKNYLSGTDTASRQNIWSKELRMTVGSNSQTDVLTVRFSSSSLGGSR